MSEIEKTVAGVMLVIVYFVIFFAYLCRIISVDTFAIVFMLYMGLSAILWTQES